MDRTSKQKISKEISALCDTLDQMDVTVTYRTFIQMQQSIYSSQVHMGHSPGQIIFRSQDKY